MVEAMTPNGGPPGTEKAILCKSDGDVTKIDQLIRHLHFQGQDAQHGVDASIYRAQLLREIEQAAALGIDVSSGSSKGPDLVEHRRICAEPPGIEFGISSAKVQRIELLRQDLVSDGAEGDNLRSLLAQQIQIVFVVERECVVSGHPYARVRCFLL